MTYCPLRLRLRLFRLLQCSSFMVSTKGGHKSRRVYVGPPHSRRLDCAAPDTRYMAVLRSHISRPYHDPPRFHSPRSSGRNGLAAWIMHSAHVCDSLCIFTCTHGLSPCWWLAIFGSRIAILAHWPACQPVNVLGPCQNPR